MVEDGEEELGEEEVDEEELEEGELELEPKVELLKVELPAGVEVLLAGWPTVPVLPPLAVWASESGS